MGSIVASTSLGDLSAEQSNRVSAATRLQKWYRDHKSRDKIKRLMIGFRHYRVTEAGKCNFVVDVVKKPVNLLDKITAWKELDKKLKSQIYRTCVAIQIQAWYRSHKKSGLSNCLHKLLALRKQYVLSQEYCLVCDNMSLLEIFEEDIKAFIISRSMDLVLLAASDRDKNIQALALHDFRKQHLNLLVTNPANLAVLGNQAAVRGAGSALVEEIVFQELMIGKNGKITLESMDTAVPFYTRLLFELQGDRSSMPTMQLQNVNRFVMEKSGYAIPHELEMPPKAPKRKKRA